MKILHLITSINTGGAEKFCVDIANEQSKDDSLEINLCIIDKLDDQPLLEDIDKKINLFSLNKEKGYDLKIIYKLHKLLTQIKPDVIHLNGRSLLYSSLSIIIKRIPTVYTVHTLAYNEYSPKIRKFNKFLFNFFPKLFVPVAISNSVSKSIQKVYDSKLTNIIYNGTSIPKISKNILETEKYIKNLKKDNDTLVFAYVGRIVPEKNTLLLIHTFNELISEGKNIILIIVGYDVSREQHYIHKCKNTNKYPEKIKFVGKQKYIADYLLQANANCMTSVYEGLGLTAIESFALGIPVLSTPAGGPEDIIVNNKNGLISKTHDLIEYKKIIESFISNQINDSDTIKLYYTKNYTMKKCSDNYLKLYKERITK